MGKKFDLSEIPATPDLQFENGLWQCGFKQVAGLDEAGRGAWAGPVTAGAVILPADPYIAIQLKDVRDSKQMLPAERSFWAQQIRQHALAWGVGFASNQEIDAMGIVPATRLAMMRALDSLPVAPDHLLVDALHLVESDLPQAALIKGDARSLSIAAASVLAKTARDARMVELDEEFPGYSFARHKGYGTACHQAALESSGPCAVHRFSFEPVKLARGAANGLNPTNCL